MYTITHQINNALTTQTYHCYSQLTKHATLQKKIKKLWNQQNILTGPFSLLAMTVLQNYTGFGTKCYTRECKLTTTNVPYLNVSIAYFTDDKGSLATRMCSMFSMGWIAWSNACWLSRQRGNRDTRLLQQLRCRILVVCTLFNISQAPTFHKIYLQLECTGWQLQVTRNAYPNLLMQKGTAEKYWYKIDESSPFFVAHSFSSYKGLSPTFHPVNEFMFFPVLNRSYTNPVRQVKWIIK